MAEHLAADGKAKGHKDRGGRRKRLPRWADRLITVVIILIGAGLLVRPWVADRLQESGVFNQITTVSGNIDAMSKEERARYISQARVQRGAGGADAKDPRGPDPAVRAAADV